MDFQRNTAVKFTRNTCFLKKAEQLKPDLIKQNIKPSRLVKIVKNERNVFGYEAENADEEITKLSSYSFNKGKQIIFDLGDHYVGHFSIDITSTGSPMDAPLFLHFKFAELPVELVEKSTEYHGVLSKSWLQDEYIHLDVLPQHLELPRRYACRYVAIEVIDSSPKWSAVFSNPEFIAQSSVELNEVQPLNTGDEQLNKIDRVGLKTLQDCMQQVFEDGPKRDRRLWLGDLHLQALANYATFDNKFLVERCLYLFGALPAEDGRISTNIFTFDKPIPDDTFFFDYGLFFISTLLDFYKQYHDQSVVDDLYLVAKNELDASLKTVNKDGLVELEKKWIVFVDWNIKFNRDTCGQAILIYALRQFIELAKIKHDLNSVNYYQKVLDKMIEATKEKLFDVKNGLFISGPQHEINLASQIWMILAHVFPGKENKQLMQNTIEHFFPVHDVVTPYMYHYIVTALFETGYKNKAVSLIKDYWGKMVEYGADTFWEAFDPDHPSISPYGSLAVNSFCHAWSCTPVYLIRKYITKK